MDLGLCVHHWKVGGPGFVCPPLESGWTWVCVSTTGKWVAMPLFVGLMLAIQCIILCIINQ